MQKIPFTTIQASINKDDFDFPTLIYDGDLRTPETETKYQKYLKKIKRKWLDVENFLICKIWNLEPISFPSSKFKMGIKTKDISDILNKRSQIVSSVLFESDFKYDLVDARFHYILCVNSNDTEIIKKAIEFERFKFAGETYEYFQNEHKNKSVPELTLFHFLVK
jgi:hypothetical protein